MVTVDLRLSLTAIPTMHPIYQAPFSMDFGKMVVCIRMTSGGRSNRGLLDEDNVSRNSRKLFGCISLTSCNGEEVQFAGTL